MLKLSGTAMSSELERGTRKLLSLSSDSNLPTSLRGQRAYIADDGPLPTGFSHYISFGAKPKGLPSDAQCTVLGEEFRYLGDKDVIAITCDGRVRSIFRANSSHNSILLTEQCNNYCLMCSQPPKRVDDRWLLDEAFEAIRLIPRETKSLYFTGGEPTLFGDGLIDLLRHSKNWLPSTALHVLSNGKAFSDINFSKKFASVDHPDVMVGIPVYSADPSRHDYVVQAKFAFDETIRGILNLKRFGQKVEIRLVIHKQTCDGLPELAEFIARNLLFVDQVALMGLEMTGFTRANLESLWIDPIEYKDKLSQAVRLLRGYGIATSVYNHPLCLVNTDVEGVYVKSISDWKNEFPQECAPCTRKGDCGGFFSSAIQYGYSKSLRPFS